MIYHRAFAVGSLVQLSLAFPHMALSALEKRAQLAGRGDPASGVPIPDPAQVAGTFDAELQYVSNTGDHAYVPPGEGDLRGPCPGTIQTWISFAIHLLCYASFGSVLSFAVYIGIPQLVSDNK